MTRIIRRPSRRVETVSPPVAKRRRIDSHLLLDDRGEVIIEHGGREYCLRETRNGKLILNGY